MDKLMKATPSGVWKPGLYFQTILSKLFFHIGASIHRSLPLFTSSAIVVVTG